MCGVQFARDRGGGVVSASHVSAWLMSKAKTDGANDTWQKWIASCLFLDASIKLEVRAVECIWVFSQSTIT